MRCIVHIWNSTAGGHTQFPLHILPLDASETLQTTETFGLEDSLCERLTELGLSVVHVVMTLHNLRDGRDAMWMNVEISQRTLAAPRERGERPPLAA